MFKKIFKNLFAIGHKRAELFGISFNEQCLVIIYYSKIRIIIIFFNHHRAYGTNLK